ncbi:hypothetical protein [Oleiagrimonas soli]|nr:hypothetical protein [Oleiagrimonas soli]
MEAAGLQPGIDTLDRIVDAESALVVLRTDQPEVVVEQFRQITRRSGQSAYVWYRDDGLRSLREGDVRVPGCRRVSDTLRYVLQSMHFGIYLMIGVEGPLDRAEQTLLRQLERGRSDQVRRVVLLTDDEALIDSVEGLATMMGGSVAGARPRLRDGRWVV